MKRIFSRIAIVILGLTMAFGCTEEMKYKDGAITPVGGLRQPVAEYYAELLSIKDAALTFSWDAATSEDGLPLIYEVVFYSNPSGPILYRIDAGAKTTVSITHKELNRAAKAAGIETGQEGVVYWSVNANKGANDAVASEAPRKMHVKRLLGFDVIPPAMYLAGSGTETDTDLENARQFSPIEGGEEGEFEIFTQLKSGTYNFISERNDGARVFTVAGGIMDEANTPIDVAETGIFRIRLDMNTRGFSLDKVENMRYVMCIKKNIINPLTYEGNGVWKATNISVNFNDGWNDDRYFFRADIGGVNTKIGAENSDFGSATTETEGKKFWIYFKGEGNPDWDYSFKAIPSYLGAVGKLVNASLYLNAEVEHYYHKIDYLDQ